MVQSISMMRDLGPPQDLTIGVEAVKRNWNIGFKGFEELGKNF